MPFYSNSDAASDNAGSSGFGDPIDIDFRPDVTRAVLAGTDTIDGVTVTTAISPGTSTFDSILGWRVIGDGVSGTNHITIDPTQFWADADATDTYVVAIESKYTNFSSSGNPNTMITIGNFSTGDWVGAGNYRIGAQARRHWSRIFYDGVQKVSEYVVSAYSSPTYVSWQATTSPWTGHISVRSGNDTSLDWTGLPLTPDSLNLKTSSGVELTSAESTSRGFHRNGSDELLVPSLRISCFTDGLGSSASLDYAVRRARIWRSPGPGKDNI